MTAGYGSPTDVPAEGVETRIDGTQVLVGIFAERELVERAMHMLQNGGFDPQEISIVGKDRVPKETLAGHLAEMNSDEAKFAEPEPERMGGQVEAGKVTEANKGTGVGLVTGAVAGAALGLAVVAIPGVGPLLAAGPVAGALGGAAVGAGAGVWTGSLTGFGIEKEDADKYMTAIDLGQWIVAVRTDRVDEVLGVFHNAGALNI